MKKVLAVSLFLSFLAAPLIVSAVATVEPQVFVCNLLQKIKNIIAVIGFALAAIILIVGGIGYMTAGGNPEKAEKAKKLMINAIIGIAILLGAILIFGLVQGLLSGTGVAFLNNPCPALIQ